MHVLVGEPLCLVNVFHGKKTIARMIALYEKQCPGFQEEGHYQALNAADKRLDKCVFGEEKPACKQCPVHCYQPAA